MNNASNNFYNSNSNFPGTGIYGGNFVTPNQENAPTTFDVPFEQSYIENILRLNRGKKAKFHITVPGSEKWQDRVFEGIIEQSGRDHIIVSNPSTGEWYLILMIYLDFVTFEESINFIKDF